MNCIYLSTTMRTQVSYTMCHCHISAHNAHQSNLRKTMLLNLLETNTISLIVFTEVLLVWILTDLAKKILN